MGRAKINEETGLTEKQEKFCRYYLDCDGNASKAYKMAYNAKNMTYEQVRVEASRLRNRPNISLTINRLKEERAKETEVERRRVMGRLMDIVMANTDDLYMEDPETGEVKLRDPSCLPSRARNAVKKIKTISRTINDVTEVSTEYELTGKVEAARLLGSWNGWDAPQKLDVNSHGLKLSGVNFNLPKKDK